MTTDSLSIPISAETGCCSGDSQGTQGLPIVAANEMKSDCAAPTDQHESCSHPQAVPGPETPAAEPTSKDVWEAPDDAALIEALRQVVDPELMINIVDLGLVYSINQTDRKVVVEMTLTSPACPAGPQIISQAKMSLEKLSGVDLAEIKLTMSPPWTPDRMTDDARDQLGIF